MVKNTTYSSHFIGKIVEEVFCNRGETVHKWWVKKCLHRGYPKKLCELCKKKLQSEKFTVLNDEICFPICLPMGNLSFFVFIVSLALKKCDNHIFRSQIIRIAFVTWSGTRKFKSTSLSTILRFPLLRFNLWFNKFVNKSTVSWFIHSLLLN